MVPVEATPDLRWIKAITTSKPFHSHLSQSLSISSDLQIEHNVALIYRGTRSEVYKITITSSDLKAGPKNFIIKRFLPPEESIHMRPGLAEPTEMQLDQAEYINLSLLHEINDNQPQPVLHDPTNHFVVMTALDGSYYKRLDEQYWAFKRSRKEQRRSDLRQDVQKDLTTILTESHDSLARVNLSSGEHPEKVSLRYNERSDIHKFLNRNLRALFKTLGNFYISSQSKAKIPHLLNEDASENRLLDWNQRYGHYRERMSLIEYLEAPETIIHGDFRPDNILYRCSGDGSSLKFALCDLTDMRKGPVDLDMISLLMDPRLRAMFSLDQLSQIHDQQLEDLIKRHQLQLSSTDDNKHRFAIGAVEVLLHNIGTVFTYLSLRQSDSLQLTSRNDKRRQESPSGISNLPLKKPEHYFVAQSLSLLQILNKNRDLFPSLYGGVLSLIPGDLKSQFLSSLDDPTQQDSLFKSFVHSYKRGKLLSQNYSDRK